MQQSKDCVVAARIPRRFKELIEEFIACDSHLNEADLVRDALREKIAREAPSLTKLSPCYMAVGVKG